jgi:hypothetical protein
MTLFRRRRQVWHDVDPARATSLADARLQLHHAAQLVAAVGISYLPKADDDSHTNMEWIAGTLASNVVGDWPFRIAVRPHPFALVVIVGDVELTSLSLNGKTITEGARWIQGQVRPLGLDPARFTLAKHYTIPAHPVSRGVPFDTSNDGAFAELQRWFGNAGAVLSRLAADRPASPVRCWPHHFDIATLLAPMPGKSVGAGLEPGDASYDEPYWYVNLYPAPRDPTALTATPLEGGGAWHTDQWLGAVLRGSRIGTHRQQEQVQSFLDSAIGACENALRRDGPASS